MAGVLSSRIWPLCGFSVVAAAMATVPLLAQEPGLPRELSRQDSLQLDWLVARDQCLTCHREPKKQELFPELYGPDIRISNFSQPDWVEAWLLDPQSLRPGTRMPSMLEGLPEEERQQAAADLRAYLLEGDNSFDSSGTEVTPEQVLEGERLFAEVGCMACHEDAFADRSLARRTSVKQLQNQLLTPSLTWPNSLMPDMHLSEDEAFALSAWLLREQAGYGGFEELPGLRWRAYAWDGVGNGPNWDIESVFAEGSAVSLHEEYGGRQDRYGILFTGTWQVKEAGEYTVYVGSDDGNRLLIDGEVVLDARVNQSHTRHQTTLDLEQGPHEFRLEYYENSGDASLEAGWIQPDGEDHPFGADALTHLGKAFRPIPISGTGLEGDPGHGSSWYQKLRCNQCHEGSTHMSNPRAPQWGKLSSGQGCLSETPEPLVPQYTWTEEERALLAFAVENPHQLTRARNHQDLADLQIKTQNCTACHEWPGLGGPSSAQYQRFQGEGDFGDEGRVPPSLHGVSAKLQPDWLEEVLLEGASVRPYMRTRMPNYNSVGGKRTLSSLQHLAPPPVAKPAQEFRPEMVTLGQQLTGIEGFACVSCHQFAGHRSAGIQGLDLVTTQERLRPEWFEAWMRDPHQFRKQTRMPVFWNEQGVSGLTKFGDGQADVQIPALWTYLSMGVSAPLPKGLVVDGDDDLLVPTDRPLYFGTFLQGLSARVLTVGFPERVHLAFDEHNVRLAKVWRGDFMRTSGTWNGRAGQLEKPAGTDVFDLPPGPAFAFLEEDQDWPELAGKEAGWRMLGHRRDALGHPTFRYQWGPLMVEEKIYPVLTAYGTIFRREFSLESTEDLPGLYWQHLRRSSNLPWEPVTLVREGELFVAQLQEDLSW